MSMNNQGAASIAMINRNCSAGSQETRFFHWQAPLLAKNHWLIGRIASKVDKNGFLTSLAE